MYLVPPMDDEPPEDFVTFVAVHLTDLQHEAARLTGGPDHADEIYPEVLADVAGHWRRLRLRRRWTGRDAAAAYLAQRLHTRAKQWRDDQVYDIEVHILKPPVQQFRTSSIALRKAAVLDDTVRTYQRPVAEAAIAWNHAWRRARWHGIARTAAALFVVFFGLLQALPAVSG